MSLLHKIEKLPGWKPAREIHSPGANLEDESSTKLAVWVYGESTLPAPAKLQMISAQMERLSEKRLWLEDAYLLRESKYREHLESLVKNEKLKGLPSDLCALVGVDPNQMCSLFVTFVSEKEAQEGNEIELADKLAVATNFSFFVPTLVLCQSQAILLKLNRAIVPGVQKNLWLSAMDAPLLYQIRVVEALASLIIENKTSTLGTEV